MPWWFEVPPPQEPTEPDIDLVVLLALAVALFSSMLLTADA